MKKLALFLCVVLVGAAGYYFWPQWSFYRLQVAIQNADEVELEKIIDFPAVRQSLKESAKAQLLAKMAQDSQAKGNPLGGLAAMFAPGLIDKVIDSVCTPAGIVRTLKEKKGVSAGPDADFSAEASKLSSTKATDMGFVGLTDYQVTFDTKVKLRMHPDGLRWRVYKVEISEIGQ